MQCHMTTVWPLAHAVLLPSSWLELSTPRGANSRKLVYTLDPWLETEPDKRAHRNTLVCRVTTSSVRQQMTMQTVKSWRVIAFWKIPKSEVEIDQHVLVKCLYMLENTTFWSKISKNVIWCVKTNGLSCSERRPFETVRPTIPGFIKLAINQRLIKRLEHSWGDWAGD